jgi:hypothetical protein
MNFEKVGIICLNRDMREECQNCLWWEWDSANQCCCNFKSSICSLSGTKIFWRDSYSSPSPT